MNISKLISELQNIQQSFGDIDCQLMEAVKPTNEDAIKTYPEMFLVPEKYESDEEHLSAYWMLNIRWWPY